MSANSRLTARATDGCLTAGGVPFRKDVPLRTCSTWRIGGPADYLVEPSSWEQVALVLRCGRENGIPVIVIGKGSNLLFDDAGLRGIVIKIGRGLSRVRITGTTVRAGSGVSASRLARIVGGAGLCGLEHIVGIPGTLGGLIFMNGGSLHRAIGDAILEVTAMDRQGGMRMFRGEECGFAYRHSRFQDGEYVITGAGMVLTGGRRDAIRAEMLRILRERRAKFPLTLPNCGSVFTSDPQAYGRFGPPGKIIESVGLKGMSVGGAAVSERHANFIVNRGDATARDVLSLIELIRRRVAHHSGLHLACEVRFVPSGGSVTAI
jgi:UDP-N-acetylmuramate dehydrogenase